MTSNDHITWAQDADGVVVLTMDAPGQGANTLSARFVADLRDTVEHLERAQEDITGVVLGSAKKTFFAGGDLNELINLTPEDAADFTAHLDGIKATFRRLELLSRPVVSIIGGAAMGGGLEIALATHHRVIADVPGAIVGLPEVGLGLLPGAGGIVRLIRMLGVVPALDQVLTTGTPIHPEAALALGLVDEVVPSIEALLPTAKEWIAQHPSPRQPWDTDGFSIPGGTPSSGSLAAQLPSLSARLRARSGGGPAPAQRAILAAAVEGAHVDIDTASLIETRYLVSLVTGQEAKNRIGASFFDTRHIKAGGSRPAGQPKTSAHTLLVVGAGMMGAGIAYAAAKAGLDVVLKDVSLDGAQQGKAYAATIESKRVQRGQTSQSDSEALLARILPVDRLDDLGPVDVVVEAVYEDLSLKRKVFAEIEEVVGPDTLLASNTSTLPITSLADTVSRPDDVVGLHFFSPVDRMALVEVIKGERTSERTLARAFDFVQQLRKTPIVVNDSRGFFTSRVILARLHEAVAALGEGVQAASIEQAALQSGYPAGPLQLLDELTLTLPRMVREEAKVAAASAGEDWVPHKAERVYDLLIDEHGRKSRAAGAGFYDYEDGTRVGLWPGLGDLFGGRADVPFVDVQDRLLFAEALEAFRCHDEGVITSEPDANVGSLLGIGFPAWTGGALRFIRQYPGGPPGFSERAEELAKRYGDRFFPPPSLAMWTSDTDMAPK